MDERTILLVEDNPDDVALTLRALNSTLAIMRVSGSTEVVDIG